MMYDAEDKYADIINLPHHVSRNHPQMSMADRAALFSPFAALTGHDAAIAEATRITDERPILDESVCKCDLCSFPLFTQLFHQLSSIRQLSRALFIQKIPTGKLPVKSSSSGISKSKERSCIFALTILTSLGI